MDRDGFDVWGSQPSASGPGHAPVGLADLDLNSQVPAVEAFLGLELYGAILQGNVDELLPDRVRGSGLPPYRPPGQRTNTAIHGGSGQRVPHPRAPRAPRSAVRGQASGFGAPFDIDEELEDDVEQLASSGGPLVKNQIGVLKNTHSFWRYMQMHTGLGRKPDGTIDAESEFWTTHTEKKQYLKRLQWGPLGNEELLDELFRGFTVDGNTAFVPGDDYGQNQEQDVGAKEEEEFQTTPISRSSQRRQRRKRSLSSNSSTLTSPVKKSKSPIVKIVKDIASTFKDSVKVNTIQIQKRASDKAACSIERCQELAFECGVEETVDSVYAMSKMFETEYQRQFFCGKLTPQLRLGYFKKCCRDNNLSLGGVE
ncbi:uncharacterized protein [Miscanthus floridulus]|uniref:uncharacterized protein n=1 Tax=Miscanthus floridulus TaxID=154761 RepID=UPI00345A9B95